MQLLDAHGRFIENTDGLAIHKAQEIPVSFVDFLRSLKDSSLDRPARDIEPVAQVPTIVVERWMSEGFNIYDPNVTAAHIKARLEAERLDYFVTTKRRL